MKCPRNLLVEKVRHRDGYFQELTWISVCNIFLQI